MTMSQYHHAVLYVFEVLPDQSDEFESAWAAVTVAIKEQCGSGGSRLYKSDNGTYWAHALWPSKEAMQSASLEGAEELLANRQRMVEACSNIEAIGEGNVVSDFWEVGA